MSQDKQRELVHNNSALEDSGADMNYIQEGIIPTKCYDKISERLHQASGSILKTEYKLSNANVCNNGICTFVLVKDLTSKVVLRNPALLYPFQTSEEDISIEILGKKVLFKFILIRSIILMLWVL